MSRGKSKSRVPMSTVITVIVSVVILLIVIICMLMWHKKTMQKTQLQWEAEQSVLAEQVNSAQRSGVYRTTMDIKKGQILSEDNTEVADVLSDDSADMFITAEDMGKEATIDIPAGQCVTTNMVTSPLSEDWQERELDCIWLSSNLKQYDYVDIRIMYPNGTDYTVVAKKPLRKVDLTVNNCYLWLNEEEMLALNSAIVDANMNGGKIYTVKYVKPAVEEAKKVNYIPTKAIAELVKADKNIVKKAELNLSVAARENMESKLLQFKKDYKSKNDTDSNYGYDFILDDTTNARGDSDGNNHGTEKKEEDDSEADTSDEENPGLVDSTRNTDVSNDATLQDDEEATNGLNN